MSLHLLLFYTQGEPFDRGADLQQEASLLTQLVEGKYTTVIAKTPHDLIQSDSTWGKTLQDQTEIVTGNPDFTPDLKWNQNWARMGFQLWKPRLILETLLDASIDVGDIVLYHDANVSKYPEYKRGVLNAPKWLEKTMRRHDIIFFRDNRSRLVSDVKKEVLDEFLPGIDAEGLKHVWAGAIALKKSQVSINFVREWLQLCEQPRLLGPITHFQHVPGFVRHSHEQALLSVLFHSKWKAQGQLIDLGNSREIAQPKSESNVKLLKRFLLFKLKSRN